MTSLADIRSTFLDFFVRNGHAQVASSPLVPRNDPTLMFVNSGMVQFKNVFTGLETRPYSRAVTAQKCVRAGGKHNDLDNVGHTARHHTFFEMLGNFSFGDYFKEDAIPYAWELLTRDFAIPADRLLVTVYHTDEEAAAIWRRVAGLPEERIVRIPTDDNFWMMGPTGPCGPSSEIFFDHGPTLAGGPPGSPEQDGDRFVEIWNLVFMQFERFEDGSQEPLPRPSIDTGMGLERIGALLQGKHDNYDTDLLRALIEASAHATSTDPDGPGRTHHRVIADHLRSTSFLIADGVMPSNEGRGYVLRRIMRRAMRHAAMLGASEPVMWRLVPALVREMGGAYPELIRGEALITDTLRREEARFRETLERGLGLLDEEVARLPEGTPLPGAAAFRLYDTYGFPLDLTQDALRERGRGVDVAGFEAAMEEQRARARASWAGSGEGRDAAVWFELAEAHGPTEFLGYETETAEGQVLALVVEGSEIEAADGRAQVVVNQTPFYAESGGQVGDQGVIETDTGRARVTDTRRQAGVVVHEAEVTEGRLEQGQAARLTVDHARRAAIRANHSATHLLGEALREALGEHVAQRGSLNAPDRLRFDFSHGQGLTAAEAEAVEGQVNAMIRRNGAVVTRLMSPDDARALGAQALFGEKYGDEVRVVSMGEADGSGKGEDGRTYSIELCGGTHVARLGEVGTFVLVSEGALASGVRRVEALTGQAALDHLQSQERTLEDIATLLKVPVVDITARIAALVNENKELKRQSEEYWLGNFRKPGKYQPDFILPDGTYVEIKVARDLNPANGRKLLDMAKAQVGSGLAVVLGPSQGKTSLLVAVTADKTDQYSAERIAKALIEELGEGSAGGKIDFAQGGIRLAIETADVVCSALQKIWPSIKPSHAAN